MSQRFIPDRWKRRIGAIRSPLMKPPTYRVLFLLVVIGIMLICLLPEAAFVLPAVDAVGLDIVTVFAALELRLYLAATAAVVGIPSGIVVYLRAPALLLYACMWALIWVRMLTGTMAIGRPSSCVISDRGGFGFPG